MQKIQKTGPKNTVLGPQTWAKIYNFTSKTLQLRYPHLISEYVIIDLTHTLISIHFLTATFLFIYSLLKQKPTNLIFCTFQQAYSPLYGQNTQNSYRRSEEPRPDIESMDDMTEVFKEMSEWKSEVDAYQLQSVLNNCFTQGQQIYPCSDCVCV